MQTIKLFIQKNILYLSKRFRLRAFTVLETVIALLLASIAAGMAYYSLLFFTRLNQQYTRNSDRATQRILFHTLLKKDFFQADQVKLVNDQIYFYNDDRPAVLWSSLQEKMIRHQAQVSDTFDVGGDKTFFLRESPVLFGLIDKLVIQEKNGMLVFRKKYAVHDLLNREEF